MRRPGPPAHDRRMTTITTDQSLRTAREAVVRAHMRAEANQDVAGTLASFSEANYDVVPLGAPTNGATAVDELLHGLFDAFPDFTPEELSLHHGDDIVFVDTMIRGTHRGNWARGTRHWPAHRGSLRMHLPLPRRPARERDGVLRSRHPARPNRRQRLSPTRAAFQVIIVCFTISSLCSCILI